MPPWRCLPSPVLTRLSSVGGLKGGSLRLAWASCPGKRLARAAPARVLAGETCLVHLIFVALVLVIALFVLCLRLLSGFPLLPCYAWPGRVALTARTQVKGSKGEPLLLYTDNC